MKITELQKVPKGQRGDFRKNGLGLEPHEEASVNFLTLYGFTPEVIKPVNTPKAHNPDFFMAGAIWELKSPTTSNLKTIKKRMHHASEQASRLIIDLRGVRKNYERVEKDVIRRFRDKPTFRRMILITRDSKVFYYEK